jgi:hypothetical protein
LVLIPLTQVQVQVHQLSLKLPLTTSTGLNAVVDWGDSTTDTITVYNAPEVTHTYSSSGTYTISITGTLPGFGLLMQETN